MNKSCIDTLLQVGLPNVGKRGRSWGLSSSHQTRITKEDRKKILTLFKSINFNKKLSKK